MSKTNAILAALTSTAMISLAPNILLFLFPHYASGEGVNSPFLALGQALAAGCLLGDVFLHTIPHAAAESGGDHDVGLWVLLGFSIFLVTDMIIRSLGHNHAHHDHDTRNKAKEEGNEIEHQQPQPKMATVSLNLVADALHNFTDGLAIGASYLAITNGPHATDATSWWSLLFQSRGSLATLSILLHEIPHELGDFAILVKNGFSKRQAIFAQFGTAVAAMLGTVAGILLEGFLLSSGSGDALILITGGGFVYLAAVSILPEILEGGSSSTWHFRVAQLLFFAIGIGFLYAVTLLEELSGEGHGHSHGHHHHHHPETVIDHSSSSSSSSSSRQLHHDHGHDHQHEVHHHGHDHGHSSHDHQHHDHEDHHGDL